LTQLTKFGNFLIDKGYFTFDFIEKATVKLHEYGDTSPSALARLLVDEFKAPHDPVYEALSKLYAFASYEIDPETMSAEQIAQTKDIVGKFPDEFKKKLFFKKIFPLRIQSTGREVLFVLAADPTDKILQEIPAQTQYKRYEVAWCKLKTIEDLIQKIAPQKNEFLQLLEEAGEIIVDMEKSDTGVNEAALDEEINKSLLVNLFEGALVEAVRKDASDVHIIPYSKNAIDLYFRVDGKLSLWHRQENTPPESPGGSGQRPQYRSGQV